MLDKLLMIFLSKLFHIIGDIGYRDVNAEVIVIIVGFHNNKVNDALEISFSAYRELNGNRIAFKAFFHHIDNAVKIGAHNVHLINIDHSGNMVLVRLSPNSFGLGLNAALCTKNRNRTVKNSK